MSIQEINALLAEGDRAAEQGHHARALCCFERVLPHAPRSPAVLVRTAQAHFDLGEYAKAAGHFLAAAIARPGEARYWHNLGVALKHAGRAPDAEQAWRRAVAADASYAKAWIELGRKLEKDARLWEAEDCYHRALDLTPGDEGCLVGLSAVKLHQGEPKAALRWLGKAISQAADNRAELFSSYLLTAHYHPRVRTRGLAILGRQAGRYWPVRPTNAAESLSPFPRPGTRAGERLAVGYLSPRLGDTPPGRMLLELLGYHDRDRIESFCYSTWRHEDRVANSLRGSAEHWRDVEGMDCDALVQHIRNDGIAVLVDLAGHSPGGRIEVMCRRAAPVQLAWLDYFDTMGLACYDGTISDVHSSPAGDEAFFVEKILRLPACRFVFAPPEDRIPPGPLPALRRRALTFGSFNRMSKLNDDVLRLWARILDASPGSRLVVKNSSLNAAGEHGRHRKRFAALGIPAARLVLLGTSDAPGLWADYRRIDIALDPFPFNGGITTFDALSMGVPVLTLSGESMVSRQSASMVVAVGMNEWVTEDPEACLRLAGGWNHRLAELAALRERLPGAVAASPLCDRRSFARAIESLYFAAVGS